MSPLHSKNITKTFGGFSQSFEDKILYKLVPKVAKIFNADALSLIALLGAIWTSLWIYLSDRNLLLLPVSLFGLAMHWFGDGLDGKVAAYKKESRPRYGYYMDRMLDTISLSIIFLSAHFSSLTLTNTWLYLTIVVLIIAVHIYLKASVTRVYEMYISRFGGLELKIFGVVTISLLVLSGNPTLSVFWYSIKLMDAIGIVVLVAGLVTFINLVSGSLAGKKKIRG